jgi:hypothetical protein
MKLILIILTVLICAQSLAATTKKKSSKKTTQINSSEVKVYEIDTKSPEILLGKSRDIQNDENQKKKNIGNRPAEFWSFSLVRSSLTYHLSTIMNNSLDFSPVLIGVNFGKKIENQFFLYKGYYEISGEWQRFKRESLVTNALNFSQNLNLYQINLYQNFNIVWAFKHSALFTVGVGIAPVLLTTEQSVFGNSTSDLGFMGLFKGNMIVPLKHSLEADLSIKLGWGSVAGHNISLTSLGLGLNFE